MLSKTTSYNMHSIIISKIKHVSTHLNQPQILITTYCYKTELELFCEDNSKSLTQSQSTTLSRVEVLSHNHIISNSRLEPKVPSPWSNNTPCETSFTGNTESLERKRNKAPINKGFCY